MGLALLTQETQPLMQSCPKPSLSPRSGLFDWLFPLRHFQFRDIGDKLCRLLRALPGPRRAQSLDQELKAAFETRVAIRLRSEVLHLRYFFRGGFARRDPSLDQLIGCARQRLHVGAPDTVVVKHSHDHCRVSPFISSLSYQP